MKGIVLAGDSGDVLHPLTKSVPKQLLPIYDRPMIHYPLMTLANSGITDIMVITTTKDHDAFYGYLGNGELFDMKIEYGYQDIPIGVADSLRVAKDFIGSSDVCLITGDTVLVGGKIHEYVRQAQKAIAKSGSATIFLKNEMDENQYGKYVCHYPSKEKLILGKDSEKPYKCIVGLYVYPNNAIRMVDSLKLSERGKYEITSLNQLYLEKNRLQAIELEKEIAWLDNNSFDTLLYSNMFVKNFQNNGHQ